MERNQKMDREEMDRQLSSPGQLQIRDAVRALPEEPLSMAWRSELNTQLRAVAVRRKKLNLFGWVWKPTVGLALAGGLAVALFVHPTSPSRSGGDIESGLVNHFVDSANAREVAGDGITPNESKDSAGSSSATIDWDQEDVGATL